VFNILAKAKVIARRIKKDRAPKLTHEFGKHVPGRDIADKLVDGYFRTFETVFRVLHVPTFWQDYHRYWESPESASVVFVVQLQLCMALGACVYDDEYSYRQLAWQWIYEAQLWLISPMEKSRLNIPGIQTMILVHLAREAANMGGDLVWITVGNLVRVAMYIGLHRDPVFLPPMSVFMAEMRRRLWATILELSVQSSLDSGGPVLISAKDYDARPPGNFNDDQLIDRDGRLAPIALKPVAKSLTNFTQTTVQIVLLKSFALRLSIARHIADFRTAGTYDETIRLSSELSAACHALSSILQSYRPGEGLGRMSPTQFQLRLVDHLTHRLFISLHQMWLAMSTSSPKYYFSRKLCVETALRLYRNWEPRNMFPSLRCNGAHRSSTTQQSAEGNDVGDFERLTNAAAGGYRAVVTQCVGIFGLDLIWQLEDHYYSHATQPQHVVRDRPHDPSTLMPGVLDKEVLLQALEASVLYGEFRIRAGQTNIKGYGFVCCLLAHAKELTSRAGSKDVDTAVIAAGKSSLTYCVGLLEELASKESGKNAMVDVADAASAQVELPSGVDDGRDDNARGGLEAFNADVMDFASASEWGWEDLVRSGREIGSVASPRRGMTRLHVTDARSWLQFQHELPRSQQ
jgi:hypothetical protein